MKKAIVIYFSAEQGKTRRIAETLAGKLSADLFEITPEMPYSEADLKWTNPLARCNREKIGLKRESMFLPPPEAAVSGKQQRN